MLEKIQENKTKLINGIGVLLLILVAGVIFFGYDGYSRKMEQYQSQVSEKQDELKSAKESVPNVSEDDAKNTIHSVKKIGDEVANAENGYMASTSDEDRSASLAVKDKYFGEKSNMRTVWFSGNTEAIQNGTWKFQSSFDFNGTSVNVLWTYTDTNGQLLAYVTATYDAENETFSNAKKHVTAVGAELAGYTATDENPSIEEFNEEAYLNGVYALFDEAGLSEEFQKNYQEYQSNFESENEGKTNADVQEENEAAREALKEQEQKGGN